MQESSRRHTLGSNDPGRIKMTMMERISLLHPKTRIVMYAGKRERVRSGSGPMAAARVNAALHVLEKPQCPLAALQVSSPCV